MNSGFRAATPQRFVVAVGLTCRRHRAIDASNHRVFRVARMVHVVMRHQWIGDEQNRENDDQGISHGARKRFPARGRSNGFFRFLNFHDSNLVTY